MKYIKDVRNHPPTTSNMTNKGIFSKIRVMWLKRKLVKYIDEFLDDNSEFSDSLIKHLEQYGIPIEWIIKRFGVKENIERRKMIKLIMDCEDDGYIEIYNYHLEVTNKGRMFVKWYVFFGEVLKKMNLNQIRLFLIVIGMIIGVIVSYIIPLIIKLL